MTSRQENLDEASAEEVKNRRARSQRAHFWLKRSFKTFLLLSILSPICLFAIRAYSSENFPRFPSIEPNVNFWIDVFTRYSTRDFIVHDRDKISRIYEVFHLDGYGDPTPSEIEWVNAYLKAKYRDIFDHLRQGWPPLGYDERHVASLFEHDPFPDYAQAADNLRVQQGMRERFRAGLVRADFYKAIIERELLIAGVPLELAVLPGVESCFYAGARSHAGAVGLWQLTAAAAREYDLVVNRSYDERFDIERSTEAAARIVRRNYEHFGSWPLAITAYIYGTAGMDDAVAAEGSDFEKIFKYYRGPHFGFASRNYYAEFLAALEVSRNRDKYFPGIETEIAMADPPPTPSVWRGPYTVSSSARHSYLHHAVWHPRSHHAGHRHGRSGSSHHRHHHAPVRRA